jgi:hypothetical protein
VVSGGAHILADAGLTDIDAEFEQFAVDTWRTPERILSFHASDQLAHVLRNRWAAKPPATNLPPPKQPKALAMPRDDGVRLDDEEW